jgi:hypothetical protein
MRVDGGKRREALELAAHIVGTGRHGTQGRSPQDELVVPHRQRIGEIRVSTVELLYLEFALKVRDLFGQIGRQSGLVEAFVFSGG